MVSIFYLPCLFEKLGSYGLVKLVMISSPHYLTRDYYDHKEYNLFQTQQKAYITEFYLCACLYGAVTALISVE